MALTHNTRELGINDAAAYKMLTDPSGAPPTYSAKVDVTGVQSLECTFAIDTKTLRGDNTLLAADSILKEISGTLTYAKRNFDLVAAVTNATAADAGTTPNQTITQDLSATTLPVSFKIEAQTKQTDYIGGDSHIILWKCAPGNVAFGFAEENYRAQTLPFIAFPVIGTPSGAPAQAWIRFLVNETSSAIV